ncbi:helix-turn-helix transcriptional regulator [Streptomyces goshikiensis]|uniref:helix-turn-helix transcriptional regulator n=1 Tax=Streptomyces goshikiensis TaxID=1942 RepID=UPI0037A90739
MRSISHSTSFTTRPFPPLRPRQGSEYSTAERLKSLRGGLTQEGLAQAASVSVGVVRELERGGTAPLPSLLSIADALGTGRRAREYTRR